MTETRTLIGSSCIRCGYEPLESEGIAVSAELLLHAVSEVSVCPETIEGFTFDGKLTHIRLTDGSALSVIERPSFLVEQIQEDHE